jgi:hypothetical protein
MPDPHWHDSTPPCEADADSNGNVLIAVYEIKNFQGPYKLELHPWQHIAALYGWGPKVPWLVVGDA